LAKHKRKVLYTSSL